MLRFVLGVAVGLGLATIAGHVCREREKQQLVDEIAKLHAESLGARDDD